MFKNILKRYHLHMPTLYMTLGMVWGMAIFGFILFEVLMRLIICKEPDAMVFQMAFLMAFVMYIGSAIFTGGISSFQSFNTAISMGCTRRNYIVMRTVFLFITNFIALLSVYVIYVLEKFYLNWQWDKYPLEFDLSFLLNPLLLLTLWIAGTLFPFFISALNLRFGKVVTITTYFLWLIGCFSFAHIEDFLHSDSTLLLVRIFKSLQPYQWCVMLIAICIVLYAIAYRLYKKQAVVA